MSETFAQIITLIADGDIQVSAHAYDELVDDGLFVRDIFRESMKGLSWRIILIIIKDPACWCGNKPAMAGRFMSYGESQEGRRLLRWS